MRTCAKVRRARKCQTDESQLQYACVEHLDRHGRDEFQRAARSAGQQLLPAQEQAHGQKVEEADEIQHHTRQPRRPAPEEHGPHGCREGKGRHHCQAGRRRRWHIMPQQRVHAKCRGWRVTRNCHCKRLGTAVVAFGRTQRQVHCAEWRRHCQRLREAI